VATISSGHRSIDPHCIFSGYTFCQYNYGSAVYFMAAIPKTSFSLKHRYACLGFEICHNICLMVVCIFFRFICVHTLSRKSLQSTSVIIVFELHTLGGNLLHLKITHFDSVASVIITSVASVKIIRLPCCLCRASNDITKTLKKPERLVWKKRNHLTESTNLFPLKELLKIGFWRGELPYHCQGVLVLPEPLRGSV
jgi:hypothetical protein